MQRSSPGSSGQRELLGSLAHDAMLEYNLLPEFGPGLSEEFSDDRKC